MADTPTPRSFQEILGTILDTFIAAQGLSSQLRVGSPLLSIFESAATSDTRSSQDIFGLLNSISLDSATGIALERIGADENVPKIRASAATDSVTVSDTSFTKISTKVFQGLPAPIAGSTAISVVDFASAPSTGSIYLGRGTLNYEGPLAYSSKSNAGTHWVINLTTGTAKFHNQGETVILAQGGNRVVGAGAIVKTSQANLTAGVEFKTFYSTTIPDGETSIAGVLVQCTKPGIIGNVPANSINQFGTEPFTGAAVTNPAPFSNGLDTESDDDYRERIRAVRRSRVKGTPLAIITAITGVTAPDENKRITSASFVKRQGQPSAVYIDDGTGYEERVAGVAVEALIDSAVGGEEYFETKKRPIAKAFAVSKNSAPYSLSAGDLLAVKVGGVSYVHNFDASSFRSISNATAYEVTASINANADLGFIARTSESGTKVVVFAKKETNEDIEVVAATDGVDANVALGFPAGVNYSIQLYKNDRLLSKDGTSAVYHGNAFPQWDSVTGSQTLILAIDNTPEITFTFVDQDFVDADTGYAAVGRNSVDAWIAVINARIPGVTASLSDGRLTLTSNVGASDNAAVEVVGGTLVAARFFDAGVATGDSKDYTVDRATGQIHLETPLSPLDRLSIGSYSTRAFLESLAIPTTTFSDSRLWFSVDGSAEIVPTGISRSTQLTISVLAVHDWGHTLKVTAVAGTPFANVLPGDSVILWDPALDSTLQGAFKVVDATSSYFVIERRAAITQRAGHKSIALTPVGANISRVFTCGGHTRPTTNANVPVGVTNTCEIYDPNTGEVTTAAGMAVARANHSATKLANGKIVVVGGVGVDGLPLDSIEIYNASTNIWTTSAQTLLNAVSLHGGTLMASGKVLISGGKDIDGIPAQRTYEYDESTDTLAAVGLLATARYGHQTLLLPNANILASGGFDGAVASDTCELYVPGGSAWIAADSMSAGRQFHSLQPIGTGAFTTVMALGDGIGGAERDSYEIYTIGTDTWAAAATIPSAQLYERKTGVWTQSGDIAYLHSFATPAVEAAFTYDGSFNLKTANPLFTEAATKYDVQYVLLYKADLSYLNHVVAVGGLEPLSAKLFPSASYEEWNGNTDTWTVPEIALDTAVTVAEAGVVFVRSEGLIQEVVVPAAADYTASSLATVFTDALRGATARTYHTNQLRVNTNSHALGGDIALVAQDQYALAANLDTTDAIENLVGHIGSIESGSYLGTPSFLDMRVVGEDAVPNAFTAASLLVSAALESQQTLVGLRNFDGGPDGSVAVAPAGFYGRRDSNVGFPSSLSAAVDQTELSKADVRVDGIQEWMPGDRVYAATPFALGPDDDLKVIVDNDFDKRFDISLSRRLAAVGNVYSLSNEFTDDEGAASLAVTFGLEFDFNDFAVYMASRAVAFDAVANKKLLLRYLRPGADGDGVRVRFSNPDAPEAAIEVETDVDSQPTTDVRVKIAGGVARTLTVRQPTKLGVVAVSETAGGIATLVFALNLAIASAARVSNVTTLTLTLPAGVTNHGFGITDNVYVASTDPDFSSGLKNLTAVTATTIEYAEVDADDTAGAIGTVSFDSTGEVTYLGSGILATDFIRINNEDGSFLPAFANETFAITSVGTGSGNVRATSGERTSYFVSTTLEWYPLGQPENLQVFANPSQSVATIVAAVNALDEDGIRPISMTLLGSGAGTIVKSTPEAADDTDAWYVLADGVNYVANTVPPLTTAGDYELQFKNAITGDLATDADWENEVIYIAPTTTKNVVDWLNAPTVSGLFTVCTVEESSDGAKVQIASKKAGSAAGVQVQGGRGNSLTAAVVGTSRFPDGSPSKSVSTIRKTDAETLRAGAWCEIQNAIGVPKATTFNGGTALVTWDADGTVNVDTAVYTELLAPVDAQLQFERQGKYIAVSDPGLVPGVDFSSVVEGSFLRIIEAVAPTSFDQTSSANQGIFRVLRVARDADYGGGTIWIENTGAFEEVSECNIAVYSPDSVMPGDQFIMSTPTWGIQNQGTWTVEKVGTTTPTGTDQFTVDTRFKVSVADRGVIAHGAAVALGAPGYRLLQMVEGQPCKFVKRIENIAPNQADPDFVDIRWDETIFASAIAASAGSVITVQDKLGFALEFAAGFDSYSYNTGLIGEANRILQGDPADTSTYPGVAAAGSQMYVSGPVVKRVRVALSLRVRSNVNKTDIANRVRSAVATAINQTGIGQAIALSKIVSAASRVVGVVAVTVVSPTYSVGSDLIQLQPAEKALVLDLDTDITITFSGE